jgi:creatinine amidohydrolase/Fe(II)-dependent formamide hydrolase-like protein
MKWLSFVMLAGTAATITAQAPTQGPVARPPAYKATDHVDLELMTWVEVKDAIAHGKTTALVFNGGTETRGPQAVNGGHTLVAHAKVVAIAKELGNAIAAPVLPFSPNNASADLPGTIGLSADTFKQINKEIAEQLIKNGFKNVVLMGDHGGGQKQLGEVATELDAKYAPQGIRVVYCNDAYEKSNADYDAWLEKNGYSPGGHASINDTSEMMYLEPTPDFWVRSDKLPEAWAPPRPPRAPRPEGGSAAGTAPAATTNAAASATGTTTSSATPAAPRPPRAPGNGVQGDGRRSNAALGKYGYDIHVKEAVDQIKLLLSQPAPAAPVQ